VLPTKLLLLWLLLLLPVRLLLLFAAPRPGIGPALLPSLAALPLLPVPLLLLPLLLPATMLLLLPPLRPAILLQLLTLLRLLRLLRLLLLLLLLRQRLSILCQLPMLFPPCPALQRLLVGCLTLPLSLQAHHHSKGFAIGAQTLIVTSSSALNMNMKNSTHTACNSYPALHASCACKQCCRFAPEGLWPLQ
jgi:hypothetical protein